MRQAFELRAIIGTLIWVGLVAFAIMFTRQTLDRAPAATEQIAQYIGNQRRTVEINFPYRQYIAVGDQVFLADSDKVAPIGVVSQVKDETYIGKGPVWSDRAFVTLYGSAPTINKRSFLEYHEAPDSSAWVLQTMLPPEKRQELTQLIVDSYQRNQTDIVNALRPVVEESLRDASDVIRDDLKIAFEAREDTIRKIGQRYQTDLVQKELVPLIQQEILPIVKDEGEPLANQVGQEIWSKVSVFRFGWRYMYDKTPLPDRKLTEKEFKRFVDEKAMPILQSHVEDFVVVQKRIIERLAKNPKVKASISKSLQTVIKDPEVQDLLRDVFQEVFLDNDRLTGVLEAHWQSPAAQRALRLANQRMEPTITDIGISLFGSPREKITPEFARVLRHRILHKDTRWLSLHVETDDAVEMGSVVTPPPKALRVVVSTEHAEIPYAPARNVN